MGHTSSETFFLRKLAEEKKFNQGRHQGSLSSTSSKLFLKTKPKHNYLHSNNVPRSEWDEAFCHRHHRGSRKKKKQAEQKTDLVAVVSRVEKSKSKLC